MPEVYEELGLKTDEFDRIKSILKREPNFLETVLYSLLWSEHCAYKHSKPQLKNLPTEGRQVIQGPGENAGVVDIGDGLGIAFKMESHNHPSAIEPFNGAATGVGGIIRDVLSMNARPIALLNSLRFGDLKNPRTKYLFEHVVHGIASYGNCTGIPTVGGEIYFEDAYEGNPLVNAMCVGLLKTKDMMRGYASGPGNLIILYGSKTGRDGIGGASVLASQEFAEGSEEKRPSVQVGDPFTKKLLIEASLEMMDMDLLVGLQDLGAAGIASSASDMAGRAGSGVELDMAKVPQREPGMKAWELIVSESQERMLGVIEPQNLEKVRQVANKYELELSVIGKIIKEPVFRVLYEGNVEGEVPVSSLAENLPVYYVSSKRPDYIDKLQVENIKYLPVVPGFDPSESSYGQALAEAFKQVLASPNIASRKWVYEQYDHMVQTNTVLLPGHDAAVIRIKGTPKAIALSSDCNGRYVYLDPQDGAKIAVVECCRNLVASGARPLALTDCLNFGNPEKPEIYWQFEQAIQGLREASLALDSPFVSGNVSFYNESFGEAIFPTPTVGAVGLIDDVTKRVPSAPSENGDVVFIIGHTMSELGGSEYLKTVHGKVAGHIPVINLTFEKAAHDQILGLISEGLLSSCHDLSDGGIAVALAEMAVRGKVGLNIDLGLYRKLNAFDMDLHELLFSETQGRFLCTVHPDKKDAFMRSMGMSAISFARIGVVEGDDLSISGGHGGDVDLRFSLGEISDIYENSLERALKMG